MAEASGRTNGTPGRMVMGRVGRIDGTGIPGPMAGVGKPVLIGRPGRTGGRIAPTGGNADWSGLVGGEVGLIGGDPGGEKVTLSGLVGGEVNGILPDGTGLLGSAKGSTVGGLRGMVGRCAGGRGGTGCLVDGGDGSSSVGGDGSLVGGTEAVGSCCTMGADVVVPIGGRGTPPMGGRGILPMGGSGSPPILVVGFPAGGGVGVLLSEFSELPLELESSSEDAVGVVFLGTFFPPLGPFPFSGFQEVSSGICKGGNFGSSVRGSSLAGFRPAA